MKDILLDRDGDLLVVNGDFVMGESNDQEVEILLQLNKGDLKEDPLLGTDLIKLVQSNISEIELKQMLKIQFARDGKNYDEIKQQIQLKTQ